MSPILPRAAFQIGADGIGRFIVGYALKKIGKIVAAILGLTLFALIYLGT